jgi:hypothetical protein
MRNSKLKLLQTKYQIQLEEIYQKEIESDSQIISIYANFCKENPFRNWQYFLNIDTKNGAYAHVSLVYSVDLKRVISQFNYEFSSKNEINIEDKVIIILEIESLNMKIVDVLDQFNSELKSK